jgi:lipopolysaccharide/colanic/teichoic acid biosynthesis glycosyltransferase
MKRAFDLCLALLAMLVFIPLFLVVAILIKLDTPGSVLFKQCRVGRNGKPFMLYKFRTMHMRPEPKVQLTIGSHDPRITSAGYWLRKYKIDELPQIINVLLGDMSFVGPRPELVKYVKLYSQDQQRVLTVKPGITDWASIAFCNESDLLAHAADPESFYINEIIPVKLSRSLQYIDKHDIWTDIKILYFTFCRVVKN